MYGVCTCVCPCMSVGHVWHVFVCVWESMYVHNTMMYYVNAYVCVVCVVCTCVCVCVCPYDVQNECLCECMCIYVCPLGCVYMCVCVYEFLCV